VLSTLKKLTSKLLVKSALYSPDEWSNKWTTHSTFLTELLETEANLLGTQHGREQSFTGMVNESPEATVTQAWKSGCTQQEKKDLEGKTLRK
jgi:hypothetical protein